MNNKAQQRFDRSIRDALRVPRHPAPKRTTAPYMEPQATKLGRMVLLLDPETGGTALVPYQHPLAAAKRRHLRATADKIGRDRK